MGTEGYDGQAAAHFLSQQQQQQFSLQQSQLQQLQQIQQFQHYQQQQLLQYQQQQVIDRECHRQEFNPDDETLHVAENGATSLSNNA